MSNTYEWHPASEPPKDNRNVIIYEEGQEPTKGFFFENWRYTYSGHACMPILWTELPTPPERPDPFEEWWANDAATLSTRLADTRKEAAKAAWHAALKWKAGQ